MIYAPHDSLIRPARASAHPMRLLIGCVLIVVIYISLALLYARIWPAILGHTRAYDVINGETPLSVLILLSEFACLIVALMLVLRTLHRRPLLGLIGRKDKARGQFLRCVQFLLPLYLFLVILPMPEPYQLSSNLVFGRWLFWLPLALPLLLVQVSAEELIFRGYLQSQMAARFRHPLIWIGLPSLLFGFLHYSPSLAGENAWVLVLWATLFGASAADLTARTGTLGPALALHFVNNIFAVLVTAPLGDLDGLSLYTFPLSLDEAGIAWVILPIELLFTLCAWLTARLALRV